MKLPYIIIVVLTIYNFHIKQCNASHSSMCLGLPVEPSSASNQLQSLGIEHLFPLDIWDYFKTPVEQWKTAAEIAPDRPTVRLYAITVDKPNDKEPPRYLNGWLNVEIIMQGTLGFVLCAHDENKQPVGQFENVEFPTKCGKKLPQSTYNIIPCGSVPAYEPEVPNCIVYIHPSLGDWNRTSPLYEDPLKKRDKIVFFWHFSQQSCNLKEMIHFRGYFIQNRDDPKAIYHPLFRDVYIKSNVIFGAADPAPDPDDIKDCRELVDANKPEWVDKVEGELGVWTWIYGKPINNDDYFEENTGCPANYFGGRCVKVISKKRGAFDTMEQPNTANLPKCQTAIKPKAGLFDDYDGYIKNSVKKCTCQNQNPDGNLVKPGDKNVDTTEEYVGESGEDDENDDKSSKFDHIIHSHEGLKVNTLFGNIIWGLRKAHGVCMVIVTMFLTPISVFVARYFKESCMSVRVVYLQIWHFIHIQIIPLTIVLIVAGMIAILIPEPYIGSSLELSAYVHSAGGWISISIFGILALLGGVRTKKWVVSVCSHWFFGMCFYISCYLLLLNAVYLHGSPTVDYEDDEHDTEDKSLFLACLVVWVIIDVAMHIIMSCVLAAIDSSIDISNKRLYTPSPIPLIHKDTKVDLPGTTFRVVLLFFYGGISFIITVVMCTLVLNARPGAIGFGPMSCTHTDVVAPEASFQQSCFYPPFPEGEETGYGRSNGKNGADYYENH